MSPGQALLDDVRRQLPRPLATAAALMAVGALAEGLGLLTILPLLTLATTPGNDRPSKTFIAALALFVLIMSARAWLLFARDRAIARLENGYDASLRLRAAATLAERGWPFAATVGQAGMQTLLANDVPRTAMAVHQGLAAATAALMLLVQLAVAASLSPPLALVALGLLLLGLPSLVALAHRAQASAHEIIAGQEDSARAAHGFHAGLKAALAQGTVAAFLQTYRTVLDRLAAASTGFTVDLGRSRARHAMAAAAGAVGVVAAGHWLALDLARLTVLLILFARMSGPAQALQQSFVGIAAYAASFTAMTRRLGPLVVAVADHDPQPKALNWSRLDVDQVGLAAGATSRLAPISFSLASGEWIALVGQSGAGKTTLLDLVAGLDAPGSGHILIDGAPLNAAILGQWRSALSYVGQQDLPFAETIRAALGGATEATIWPLLDLVGLGDLVRGQPVGLDLPLADRGARLSGGERQRLMIARALLRSPTLLLLDEATAAIDIVGEAQLVTRLRTERPTMAVILVAHRAESAALCDRIITVGDGG